MWVNLVATMVMIAGIFATYSYLAEYLGKISSMNGKQISVMLLLFGTTGIAGNWLTGLALSRNVLLTTRFFLLSLIGVHVLAYVFGGLFIPMTAIIGIWGFIHTGGFLIGQTRSTSEAPEAPELAASLMVSFGNAGVTLGTFLGGIIITRFGVHEVIWISILLLLGSLALTFIFVRKRAVESNEEKEEIVLTEPMELSQAG